MSHQPRPRIERVARNAAGLTVSLTALTAIATVLGISFALDRARELWGN